MRPLYMKVEAFGPYVGVMEYPMEQLGAEGIYLLSGHTGAGKTTLFDGISYALFRKASGEDRLEEGLRNRSAPEKVFTRVELLFSVGDVKYQVERTYRPPYGKSTKPTRENILKVYPTGNLKEEPEIYEKSEVKTILEQVLKVEKEQFSQIAMIAQGDFQSVLLSTTSKRQEVYRKIFQTEKYNVLQERIQSDYSRINKATEAIEKGIVEKLSGVTACSFRNRNEFDTVPVEGMEQFIALEEHFDTSENLKAVVRLRQNLVVDGDRDMVLEELRESHEEMQQKLLLEKRALQKERGEIEQYFSNYQHMEDVKQEKDAILEKLRVATAALTLVQGEKARLSTYPEEIRVLLESQKVLEGKLEISKEVARLDQDLKTLTQEQGDLEHKVVLGKDTLEKQRAVYQQFEEDVKRLPELRVAVKTLEEEEVALKKTMEQLVSMGNLLKTYENLQGQMKTAGERYQELVNFHQEKVVAHTQAVSSYLLHQAGILASTLKEGEPCSVCGSLDHPHKADSTGLDKESLEREMERLQGEMDLASSNMVKSREHFSESDGKFRQCQGEVVQQGDMLLGTKDISLMGAMLLEKQDALDLSDVTTRLGESRKACQTVEAVSASMEGHLQSLTEKEESLRKTEDKLLTLVSGGKALEAERVKKAAGLSGETMDSLSSALGTVVGEIQGKQAEITAVENRLVQCEKDCHGLSERKSTLDEMEVSEALLEQCGDYELRRDLLKEKQENHDRQWDMLVAVLSGNRTIEDYVKEKGRDNRKKMAQVAWMVPLNRVASGVKTKEENGTKIGFETFVQQHYFADVLAEANVVYHQMNQGKYTMVPGEKAKSRGQVGLDVLIFEENTGLERAASTLSGGEAFQASLALALGFSSSVQKKSGAVQMESLFLDEGFGSLDGLSLDKAIEALVSVAGQGRLIGVISHVESMKDIIDKKILFRNEGSDISVKFQV